MSRSRLVFICFSLTTVFLVAGTTMLAAKNSQKDDGVDSLYKYLSVFTEVFSLVNRAYVDELDPENLMAGAFEGAVIGFGQVLRKIAKDRIDVARRIIFIRIRVVAVTVAPVTAVPVFRQGSRTGDDESH